MGWKDRTARGDEAVDGPLLRAQTGRAGQDQEMSQLQPLFNFFFFFGIRKVQNEFLFLFFWQEIVEFRGGVDKLAQSL